MEDAAPMLHWKFLEKRKGKKNLFLANMVKFLFTPSNYKRYWV